MKKSSLIPSSLFFISINIIATCAIQNTLWRAATTEDTDDTYKISKLTLGFIVLSLSSLLQGILLKSAYQTGKFLDTAALSTAICSLIPSILLTSSLTKTAKNYAAVAGGIWILNSALMFWLCANLEKNTHAVSNLAIAAELTQQVSKQVFHSLFSNYIIGTSTLFSFAALGGQLKSINPTAVAFLNVLFISLTHVAAIKFGATLAHFYYHFPCKISGLNRAMLTRLEGTTTKGGRKSKKKRRSKGKSTASQSQPLLNHRGKKINRKSKKKSQAECTPKWDCKFLSISSIHLASLAGMLYLGITLSEDSPQSVKTPLIINVIVLGLHILSTYRQKKCLNSRELSTSYYEKLLKKSEDKNKQSTTDIETGSAAVPTTHPKK